jgi:hypothetical protein
MRANLPSARISALVFASISKVSLLMAIEKLAALPIGIALWILILAA